MNPLITHIANVGGGKGIGGCREGNGTGSSELHLDKVDGNEEAKFESTEAHSPSLRC